MKLSSKQFFYMMSGLVVLVGLLCLGGVYLSNSILTARAAKLDQLKLESEILDRQKQDITVANASIKKYEDLEQIAKQVVPQDKDQTRAVREIIGLAQKSGIGISSITFPSSNLGQKTTKAQGEKASNDAGITQVKPVSGMQGVYELEIIIRSSEAGTNFGQLTTFLNLLESNQRTSQVSSLDINPDSKDPNRLTFNMTIKVYLRP